MRNFWKNFWPYFHAGGVGIRIPHASWFADEIFALLKSCNRALCVAETEERVTPMW